jgi:hypothetical protein
VLQRRVTRPNELTEGESLELPFTFGGSRKHTRNADMAFSPLTSGGRFARLTLREVACRLSVAILKRGGTSFRNVGKCISRQDGVTSQKTVFLLHLELDAGLPVLHRQNTRSSSGTRPVGTALRLKAPPQQPRLPCVLAGVRCV